MRVLILAAAAVLLASTALADPKPIDPHPAPAKSFPMSSTQFRPLFDKAVAKAEAAIARAKSTEDRTKGEAALARAKLRASIAMEDGVVTRDEAMHIFNDRRSF